MLHKRKLLKYMDWANKWLTPTFVGLAALFGTLWDHDFSSYILKHFPRRTGLHQILDEGIPLLFISCFIITAILSSFRIFTQKTMGQLQDVLSEEREKVHLVANNIETLMTGLLLRLSEKIGFVRGESSRLTIYIRNTSGQFISFGRFASDPTHSSKGRDLLPGDSGCISRAWSNDWCFESDLSYKNARKRYNVSREILTNMRMQSRFYAVKRIDAPRNKMPIAVIVFESLTKDRFPENQIQTILNEEEAYLAEIIQCLKDHIPDPQDAADRGF